MLRGCSYERTEWNGTLKITSVALTGCGSWVGHHPAHCKGASSIPVPGPCLGSPWRLGQRHTWRTWEAHGLPTCPVDPGVTSFIRHRWSGKRHVSLSSGSSCSKVNGTQGGWKALTTASCPSSRGNGLCFQLVSDGGIGLVEQRPRAAGSDITSR